MNHFVHESHLILYMRHESCLVLYMRHDSSMRHDSMRISCCKRDLTILIRQYEHLSTKTLLKEGSFPKRDNSCTENRSRFPNFCSESTFTEITEYMYFSIIWTPLEFEYKSDLNIVPSALIID